MYLCVPYAAWHKEYQQMDFVIAMQCVFYAVWTKFWNVMYLDLRLRSYAMADAVSRRLLPAVTQVRFRSVTCEICGVRIDNNRFFSQYLDFPPSISIYHCFVIVFVILFLEGQAGEALEPLNEEMLFGYQESMWQTTVLIDRLLVKISPGFVMEPKVTLPCLQHWIFWAIWFHSTAASCVS
jgi:hypothetical protein